MNEPVTAAELAEDLGMLQDDDVRAVVAEIVDLHDDAIPPEIAGEVRSVLNPHGERTAPAALYWPGHTATNESGDRSPVRGEGFYLEDDL